MGKFNKKKQKLIDILYLERSGEIYEENYNDEYKIIERDRCRIGNCLDEFLKENLSQGQYEIAKDYLENLDEKNNGVCSILNRRFYGAGFVDGIKTAC